MDGAQSNLVSILLPVRDAATTLETALASLVGQTWPHWEAIVVDDHSSDESRSLALSWQRRDPRIRVIENAGCGLVAALVTAARAARGQLLARMDADDIAAPSRLARQIRALEADPSCGACATHVHDFGSVGPGRRLYSQWLATIRHHDDVVRNMFIECPLAHPTLLLRRRAFVAVGGYRDPCPWPEDYDLVLRLWLAGWRFAVVPEPLLAWRDHPGRLSRCDPRYHPEAFRACKLHYLLRSPWLARPRPLLQWGAGREGKWWLRHWPPHMRPEAVVEVDPKKIGQRIAGVPVIAPHELGTPRGGTLLVVAVGVCGAREQIRPYLSSLGWREGLDFLFVS